MVQTFTLNIWDTAGQERFHALTPLYYRDAGENAEQECRADAGWPSLCVSLSPRSQHTRCKLHQHPACGEDDDAAMPHNLQLWSNCVSFADGALLVYDITDMKSFERVKHWVNELRKMASPTIKIVICGNKSDMERSRKVDKDAADTYARDVGATHFLTSAKMGDGVKEAFADLTKRESRQSCIVRCPLRHLDWHEPCVSAAVWCS